MKTLTQLLENYKEVKGVKEILESFIREKSYFDNHTDEKVDMTEDTIILIVTGKKNKEKINVCIGTKKTIFCLNDTYLDNEGLVHLSRLSIGGDIRGERNEEQFLIQIAGYNDTAMFTRITDFAFDCLN